MLDLVKKLMDLKGLLGPAYYGDLKEIALAALSQDWKQVIHLTFALAETVMLTYFFGPEELTVAIASDAELDAVLAQLGDATDEVTTTATDPNAKITPGEIIAIVTLIADLIKMWRDRKKS